MKPKPALGCKPYYLCAWSRILELTEAIFRQCIAPIRSMKLVKEWAQEIVLLCEMVEKLNKNSGGD